MNNVSIIFEQYAKDLKLTASENYIYVARDDFFGDIVFSVNSSNLNMISCPNLPDKYFWKMISVDCIKKKTIGFETNIGILNDNSFVHLYECEERFRKSMNILNGFKKDIMTSDRIKQQFALNEEESDFYNNILLRKADDGAGKFIFDDNIMYMAPCMLPGSKSTGVDVTGYYKTGNDYYVSLFNTHKKTGDVITLMRFLCL